MFVSETREKRLRRRAADPYNVEQARLVTSATSLE